MEECYDNSSMLIYYMNLQLWCILVILKIYDITISAFDQKKQIILILLRNVKRAILERQDNLYIW